MEKSRFLELDIFTILQISAVILIVIGIYLAFSSEGISESGYNELILSMAFLKILGELSTIKIFSVVISVLSSVILYLSLTKYSENKTVSFLVTLLFLLSPLFLFNLSFFISFATIISIFLFSLSLAITVFADKNLRYVALLPTILGILLLYPTINFGGLSITSVFTTFGSLGFLLPLSFLPFLFADLRKNELIIPFIASLILAPLFPAISLVSFSFYAVIGLAHLLKHNENTEKTEPLLVLSFLIVLYLGIELISTSLSFILVAAAAAVFIYFLLSLQILPKKTAMTMLVFLIIALAYSTDFVRITKNSPALPSSELIALFKSTASMEDNVAILEFPNAFKFYNNKEAKLITLEQLMANGTIDAGYFAMSADSLYMVFENKSSVLKFIGVGENKKNIMVFGNKAYALSLAVSPAPDYSILAEPSPILFELKSGYKRSVPFSKLRSFSSSLSVIDERNVIINLESLTDSAIYNLLLNCEIVQEGNTTKLFKVC